ncbi:MAG: nuclear transport factor 2 family protein [Myxococcota bacterium]
MSSSTAETVRAFYDLFLSGQVEEIAKRYLTDDFVLTNPLPDPIPFGGRFSGSAGFLDYVTQVAEAIEIEEFTIDEILTDGERAVVVGTERSLVRSTGRHYTMEWVHVVETSKGQIISVREYNDTAAMQRAFEAAS